MKHAVNQEKGLYSRKYMAYTPLRHLVLMLTISLAITGCGDAPQSPLGKAAAFGTTANLENLLAEASTDEIQSALITAIWKPSGYSYAGGCGRQSE
jgi:hypothetical protein